MNPFRLLRRGAGHGAFVRMFSSTVANQAILSASNLLVGLILIRATADVQYGYYILAVNSILLLNSLQAAFLHPPLSLRIAREGREACAGMVGGLSRAQSRLTTWVAGTALGALLIAFGLGRLELPLALLLATAVLAAVAALYREFFRTVLFVSRQPHAVLVADVVYVVGQFAGVLLAARTAAPATVALLTLGLSALVGGRMLARTVRDSGGIDPKGSPAVWREIVHTGSWSVGGAGAHWAFSQGYNYVVAGVLDVAAVSALAATRLLMMPINLLSSGVAPLLMLANSVLLAAMAWQMIVGA